MSSPTSSNSPASDVLKLIKDAPTSLIADCLKQLGLKDFVVLDLHAITDSQSPGTAHAFAGVAMTMRFAPIPGDRSDRPEPNTLFGVVERCAPNSVIVVEGGGGRVGFWGGHASHFASQRHVAGVVIDGYARDRDEIIHRGVPVFARGITPNSYHGEWSVVDYECTVVCGGVQVRPGDVIVGDADGVVVVPVAWADQVAERVAKVREDEELLDEWIDGGLTSTELYERIYERRSQ